jgi:hypothetical protein
VDNERIVLGSGKVYVIEFTGTIPENAVLETEENLLGLIQGGAELEYKPKFYDAKDDLGLVSKTVITEEETTLKSGIMTWNGQTLSKLCSTARVSEADGKRTVKIGGISNQDGKKYIIRFVHKDDVDGDIRTTIVGNNQAGFSIKFAKDKETVVDAEFTASPLDNEGTQIIYEEDIPGTIGTLTITSIAGTTTGTTKITISPTLTGGNSYMHKTSSTVSIPDLEDVCNTSTGYTAWNGTDDITATTGNEILIVEVDSTFKAVKAGKATVTAKA